MTNKKSIFSILTALLLCHTHITAGTESCATDSIEDGSEHAQATYAIDTLTSKAPPASTDTIASCTASDSAVPHPDITERKKSPYRFKPTQLIAPATLIGVGLIGLESEWLIYQNKEIRAELQESIGSKFTIDDFLQYSPAAASYGLKLCGVKGKHGYGDFTIILGTAYAIMALSVNPVKYITKVERPDGSTRNSFPSGHTATAFMGAELLRREYWEVSPWIGVAGYAAATTTGLFRMYNNRHWLTDVIAGAGFGILSAHAAYWLYPFIAKTFFSHNFMRSTCISPFVAQSGKGISCSFSF